MRYFLLIFGLLVVITMLVAGQRGDKSRKPPIEVFPDMDRQPKLRPQTHNEFFKNDHMSSRLPVAGTIARVRPHEIGGKEVYPFEEAGVNTGRIPGTTNFIELNPFPITEQFMKRGQQRYDIYCAPCHGTTGDGNSTVKRFGLATVADLHDAKARRVPQQPDGEIFNTITYGKTTMGPYGGIIPVEDRWAIIAYVRALQRSRLATIEDVPADQRSRLPSPPPAGARTNATAAPPVTAPK
jgi:mono/diheme cytochrome c family protein